MATSRTDRLVTHLALAISLGASFGCSGADGEHPAPAGYDDARSQLAEPDATLWSEDAAESCPSGVVRECKVMLSRQGNVQNCFVGVQLCRDEAWGPCQSPDEL
jgi:hypothetical protein